MTRQRISTISLSALIALPFVVALCILYVRAEHPAYQFDHGNYWFMFREYGEKISEGSWFESLLFQIRNADYNPLGVVLIYPFYFFFGGERSSYITAIVTFYLVPAAIITTFLSARISKNEERLFFIFTFIIVITYIPFWLPTLRGMYDISGLIFLGIATILVLETNFLERRPTVNALLLGALLWAPFLFRRWYAYSIIIFFVVTFLFGIAVHWRRSGVSGFVRFSLAIGLSGAVAAGLALSIQYGLVVRALNTSYSDIYAAYQTSFDTHLRMFFGRLGWYVGPLMIVGAAFAALTANRGALFCLALATGTFLLFSQTQVIAEHHFLPIALWLLPLYVLGIVAVMKLVARWLLGPLVAISALVFIGSLVPLGALSSWLAPVINLRPLHIEQFDEYRRLTSDLVSVLDDKERVVVFASSERLSDSLLAAIEPKLKPHVVTAPHIAAVSRFPFELLRSDYIVAATPSQTHLAPGTQYNITLPNDMILAGEGFGRAFERFGPGYGLANGITAYIYRRIRPVTAPEMEQLLDRLVAHYPSWAPAYADTMEVAFATRQEHLGETWGSVGVSPPGTLFLHPGLTPTRVEMSEGPASRVVFSIDGGVLETCPDADGVSVILAKGGEVLRSGNIRPGEMLTVSLPQIDGLIEITVDKLQNVNCDHLKASFT